MCLAILFVDNRENQNSWVKISHHVKNVWKNVYLHILIFAHALQTFFNLESVH